MTFVQRRNSFVTATAPKLGRVHQVRNASGTECSHTFNFKRPIRSSEVEAPGPRRRHHQRLNLSVFLVLSIAEVRREDNLAAVFDSFEGIAAEWSVGVGICSWSLCASQIPMKA